MRLVRSGLDVGAWDHRHDGLEVWLEAPWLDGVVGAK